MYLSIICRLIFTIIIQPFVHKYFLTVKRIIKMQPE